MRSIRSSSKSQILFVMHCCMYCKHESVVLNCMLIKQGSCIRRVSPPLAQDTLSQLDDRSFAEAPVSDFIKTCCTTPYLDHGGFRRESRSKMCHCFSHKLCVLHRLSCFHDTNNSGLSVIMHRYVFMCWFDLFSAVYVLEYYNKPRPRMHVPE